MINNHIIFYYSLSDSQNIDKNYIQFFFVVVVEISIQINF